MRFILVDQPPVPVVGPSDGSPARAPQSLRRTTTLDSSWPNGPYGTCIVEARARDLLTAADGTASVLAEPVVRIALADGVVETISARSVASDISGLIGVQCRGGLRRALTAVVPDDVASGSALYFLLDDVSATSLVTGFSRMQDQEYRDRESAVIDPPVHQRPPAPGFCAGYAEGAYAAEAQSYGVAIGHATPAAGDLARADDPLAWHERGTLGIGDMRRTRRLDVALDENGSIVIDALFRDSYMDADLGEVVVHEYTVDALVGSDGILRSVLATPRSLPWYDCPNAATHVSALVWMPVSTFRRAVNSTISGAISCTHLNDTMRSLAEAPQLAELLRA